MIDKMKSARYLLCVVMLGLAGCAHRVQQLNEFSAVRVYGDAVIFVSAPNRLVPRPDTREDVVGLKTLRKGESMRLIDRHGTITYEVRKVSPDEVVLKCQSAFSGPGMDMERQTRIIAVKPYGPSSATDRE
jgi:hypothetical protein